MKRPRLLTTLTIASLLSIVLSLILLSARMKSEDSKTAGMEVRVDNFTFVPTTLTIRVNSTVTWVNKDDVPHVIASDAGLFRSSALDTDDKYSHTFTKPGTYAYYCSLHPKMMGQIVVK